MESSQSDTYWLQRLKTGDRQAADVLWDRYSDRLKRFARAKLGEAPLRDRDEEDVALSAFNSFYLKAERGEFPQLDNSCELWKLLFVITIRKAINQFNRATRYENLVSGESLLGGPADASLNAVGIEIVPDAELAAAFNQSTDEMLDELAPSDADNDSLRKVARLRLEGYDVAEIARQLELSVRSIHRKLSLIRDIWAKRAKGDS